jgi:hypothetical protein
VGRGSSRSWSGPTFRQQLAYIRTVSLRSGVSVSGKPNFVRGDKGHENIPKSLQRRSPREQVGQLGGNWQDVNLGQLGGN